jgi:hypothetical protein
MIVEELAHAPLRGGRAYLIFDMGENVRIECCWAHGRFDQLAIFAAELVAERVAVIVATGSTVSARAAIWIVIASAQSFSSLSAPCPWSE